MGQWRLLSSVAMAVELGISWRMCTQDAELGHSEVASVGLQQPLQLAVIFHIVAQSA